MPPLPETMKALTRPILSPMRISVECDQNICDVWLSNQVAEVAMAMGDCHVGSGNHMGLIAAISNATVAIVAS